MNKKFSTLLVSALLSVMGVGSVSAQSGIELLPPSGNEEKPAWSNNMYQLVLGTTDTVVFWKHQDGVDSLKVIPRDSIPSDSIAYSLWCVAVTKEAGIENGAGNGTEPTYAFLNKATQQRLALAANDMLKADTAYNFSTEVFGADWDNWAFAPSYTSVKDSNKIYTYIDNDTVIVLVSDSQKVKFEKVQVNKVKGDDIKTGFSLRKPGNIVLNAAALNTKLGSWPEETFFEFSYTYNGKSEGGGFTVDGGTDVFKKDLATVPNSRPTEGLKAIKYAKNDSLVFLAKIRSPKDTFYIRSDSGWMNESGTKFMKLTDSTTAKTFKADSAAQRIGQYLFQISYNPTGDSLLIRVDTAYWRNEKDSVIKTTHPDSTYVYLQDLTTNQSVLGLTLGDSATAAGVDKKGLGQIKWGIDPCNEKEVVIPPAEEPDVIGSEYTIPYGLYTIYDDSLKRYYAAPLHGNGDKRDWVEVDLWNEDTKEGSQLLAHMPAYQWVIYPIDTVYVGDSIKYYGVHVVENREYGIKDSLFFYSNKDSIYADTVPGRVTSNVDISLLRPHSWNLKIEKIDKGKYPEAYTDKYLGYFHRPEKEIVNNLNRYIFRYFHPYTLDEGMARYLTFDEKFDADGDSLLYVNQQEDDRWGGTPFELVSSNKEFAYGAGPEDAYRSNSVINEDDWNETVYGKDSIGIVQLVRTPYVITRGKVVMDSVANKKYAMAHGVAVKDSFYMKANNYYYVKDSLVDFYTIIKAVDTIRNSSAYSVPRDVKAGVSDQNTKSPLSVNELSTERSSSFSILQSEAPLYRRFNKEGDIWKFESDVKKAAGTDSLLFFEHYRSEYLMDEANVNFNPQDPSGKDIPPHYLGIWSKDKTNKLAFHVDSARVNRDEESLIKPQYLISVDRKEVGTVIRYDTTGCTQQHGSHVDKGGHFTDDPKQCVHATIDTIITPGFVRGKYLVSYADSLSTSKKEPADVKYLDKSMKYLRVGFVDAVISNDSLLVLPADYIDKLNKDEKFSYEELKKDLEGRDRNLADNKKWIQTWKSGNKHRNYTWSFRYVEPEGVPFAMEEGEDNLFLFESDGTVDIAPDKGAWLESLNGCLVLTDKNETEFVDFISGYPGALMFNVERKTDDIDYATDNEKIDAEGVTVIAGTGNVTISGAAGRRVVISNILGQVVANTVLTSDNATVAAPQGVVIVAVEGEAAVKAIVR